MRPLFFLFKSEKKTDEGHLKQMREGLRNNLLFFSLNACFCRHIQCIYNFIREKSNIPMSYQDPFCLLVLEINKRNSGHFLN